MSRRDTRLADLVPLPDRIASTTALRACLALAAVALALLLPGARDTAWEPVALVVAGHLALTLSASALSRGRRGASVRLLTASLLLDGALLGALLAVTGGLHGPAPYLVGLHVLGVTLLASFRTGVKLALWHSLVAMVVVQAQSLGMLGQTAHPFPTGTFTAYLVVLWTVALATASFAAVNERELRRRRYDADVLQRFAAAAEGVDDASELLAALARLGVEDLLATRCVAVALPTTGEPGAEPVAVAQLQPGEDPGTVPVPAALAEGLPSGSLLARALAERLPVLVAHLRAEDDPWLDALLPGARRLLAVPFGPQDEVGGVLVLECRGSGRPWATATVERRLVATAVQACTHAGQALARAQLIGRLRDAAQRDGLTGIANRRALDTALAAAEQAVGAGPCALLLFDLDHFKALNDRHGHQVGDTVLRDVATEVQRALPPGALLARYGGEEFAVLLPGQDADSALATAEQVRLAVAGLRSLAPVTASVGVAVLGAAPPDSAALLRAADRALYAAKDAGRDRVRLADSPAPPLQRTPTIREAAEPVR